MIRGKQLVGRSVPAPQAHHDLRTLVYRGLHRRDGSRCDKISPDLSMGRSHEYGNLWLLAQRENFRTCL